MPSGVAARRSASGCLLGFPNKRHPHLSLLTATVAATFVGCFCRCGHVALVDVAGQSVPLPVCPFPQVDYYLGLQADKFIGNSVSTFTAFIILERQWLGRCEGRWCWQLEASQACLRKPAQRQHSQGGKDPRHCSLYPLRDVSLWPCRPAYHYNGGNIPLELFFPFYVHDNATAAAPASAVQT